MTFIPFISSGESRAWEGHMRGQDPAQQTKRRAQSLEKI